MGIPGARLLRGCLDEDSSPGILDGPRSRGSVLAAACQYHADRPPAILPRR